MEQTLKLSLTIWYCPELAIWRVVDLDTRKEKAVTNDFVQTLLSDYPEVSAIFMQAKDRPDTIQGLALS